MKQKNKTNTINDSTYEDMLKHRKKELRKRLKNIDNKNDVLPKGAIPIPPPNWNAPPEQITLSSSPLNNLYNYSDMTHLKGLQSYFPPSPPYYHNNLDSFYKHQDKDNDDYDFDGTELFDSIGSKNTTPLNSVTDSPLITPVIEDESKLIPIINNNNNNPSIDDNLTGNPFDKELINRIKNNKSKKKINIKNSTKRTTRKSKKSSNKLPSPLKLPNYNGGFKNKKKRTYKRHSKKYSRKKFSKKHVKK